MSASEFDPARALRKAGAVAEALAPTLIGLDEADAEAAAEAQSCLYRVTRRNGVSIGVRADLRPDRIKRRRRDREDRRSMRRLIHRTELLLGSAGDRRTFPDRPNDELNAPEILNAILNRVS